MWRSTIGKKYVVALTGALLAGFVIAHMLGNLKALEGPGHGDPALDRYAHFLRTIGSPVLPHNFVLWTERVVLLVVVTLHVTAIAQLWNRNRKAKPFRSAVQADPFDDRGADDDVHRPTGARVRHFPRPAFH